MDSSRYVISGELIDKVLTQLEMIGEDAEDLNIIITRLKLLKENKE